MRKEIRPGYRSRLDLIGIGVSMACAVHCVLLPVFFTTVPLLGIEILENIVLETITLVLSAVIGSWALLRGCMRHHHRWWPVAVFVASMGVLVVANFQHGVLETALKVVGVAGVVTAHLFNWKYSHRHEGHTHARVRMTNKYEVYERDPQ